MNSMKQLQHLNHSNLVVDADIHSCCSSCSCCSCRWRNSLQSSHDYFAVVFGFLFAFVYIDCLLLEAKTFYYQSSKHHMLLSGPKLWTLQIQRIPILRFRGWELKCLEGEKKMKIVGQEMRWGCNVGIEFLLGCFG